MKDVGWLILAILVAYGLAAVAPLPRYLLRGRVGAFVGWCFVPIVLACPVLIPSATWGSGPRPPSLGRHHLQDGRVLSPLGPRRRRLVLREYYRFLIPFPVLSAVYPDYKRRLLRRESPWPQVLRVFGGIAGRTCPPGDRSLSRLAPVRSSFALNHAVMLPTFVLAIESLSRALCGLERLAGFDTTPIDPERLPVADRLRVLAAVQRPDP
jgi:hypothetical protein